MQYTCPPKVDDWLYQCFSVIPYKCCPLSDNCVSRVVREKRVPTNLGVYQSTPKVLCQGPIVGVRVPYKRSSA